ncbi:MAG TPA: hypothetical protein VKU00_08550 [Chthonomonadaceae bacterium]|nr:hypothetical protein [Chthonomonadaceae bacterium]
MSQWHAFRLLWVSVFLGIVPPALADPWDTNTLAKEAQDLPDVVQVITGRFERNPPLFYEMRLRRVREELAQNPSLLLDYDQAGIACDYLRRDDEALGWMEKKRAALQRADQKSADVRMHWYSYYANIGTFRMHKWRRAGASPKRLVDLQQARDEIAMAIARNSNAFFGRDRIQLAMMSWIIAPALLDKGQEKPVSFLDYIVEKDRGGPGQIVFRRGVPGGVQKREEWVQGLARLVVLGDPWENLDTFDTLARLEITDKATVGYLARLRCEEMEGQGAQSLFPDHLPQATLNALRQPQATRLERDKQEEIREQYEQLRLEAEDWQKRRYDYMIVRLNAGRHPDTDPAFWKDWHDAGPPDLDQLLKRPWYQVLVDPQYISKHLRWYGLTLLILVNGLLLALWNRRRLRLQHEAAAQET